MYWAWLGIEFTLVNFTALISILQLVCRSLWQSVLQTRIWILTACVSYMSQPPGQLNATFCTSNLRQGEELHARAEDSRCCVFMFAGMTGQWMRSTSYSWRKHMILSDKWVWITCPQSWKGAFHFSLSCRIRFAQYLATIALRLVCFALPQNNPTWQADWMLIVSWSLRWIQKLALIFNVFQCLHAAISPQLTTAFIPIFDSYLPVSALDTALECLRMLPFEAGRWSKNGTGRHLWQRGLAGQVCKKAAITVGCCAMFYHVVPSTRSRCSSQIWIKINLLGPPWIMKTFLPQPLWLNSFRSFTERLFGRVATLYWISMNVEEGSPGSGQRWWVWWDGVIAPWKAETHLAGSVLKY